MVPVLFWFMNKLVTHGYTNLSMNTSTLPLSYTIFYIYYSLFITISLFLYFFIFLLLKYFIFLFLNISIFTSIQQSKKQNWKTGIETKDWEKFHGKSREQANTKKPLIMLLKSDSRNQSFELMFEKGWSTALCLFSSKTATEQQFPPLDPN